MKFINGFEKVAAITPSLIGTDKDEVLDSQRLAYATASKASMNRCLGSLFTHIVVDDSKYIKYAKSIYQDDDVRVGRKKGMLEAFMDAMGIAKQQGKEIVFIHLDDMYYVPEARKLSERAVRDMLEDDALSVVHLSNFPLLDNGCHVDKGNTTYLDIRDGHLVFDQITFTSTKKKDHSLWTSDFSENMIAGNYWPLAMWFAFYRIDFLEWLISYVISIDHDARTLAHVEVIGRRPEVWRNIISRKGGKIGYINMQFGGLEMHRNKNFLELTSLLNMEVR